MNKHIINNSNDPNIKIDEVVTRVKAFIINDNNQILLINANTGCMLPGGHKEENESPLQTLKREVGEETGIILDGGDIIVPFFEIDNITKNHKETGKNRNSVMLYYYVKTNKICNKSNIHLTDREKSSNFDIVYVDFDKFEEYIKNIIKTTMFDIYRIIAKEMLIAYSELKSILT